MATKAVDKVRRGAGDREWLGRGEALKWVKCELWWLRTANVRWVLQSQANPIHQPTDALRDSLNLLNILTFQMNKLRLGEV